MRRILATCLLFCSLLELDAFSLPQSAFLGPVHRIVAGNQRNTFLRPRSSPSKPCLGVVSSARTGIQRRAGVLFSSYPPTTTKKLVCSANAQMSTSSATATDTEAQASNTKDYPGLEKGLEQARQIGWKEQDVISALDLAKENGDTILWKSVKPMYRRASQGEVRMLTRGVIKVKCFPYRVWTFSKYFFLHCKEKNILTASSDQLTLPGTWRAADK
jgi:hypothetical protein